VILVYTARILAAVANVQNALEANGIPCVVRNEFLNAGSGQLPVAECWPEVWVTNDGDAERARKLIAEAIEVSASPAGAWRCTRCGEEVDAVFARCWSCGAELPRTAR
jgi:hypothetical protein